MARRKTLRLRRKSRKQLLRRRGPTPRRGSRKQRGGMLETARTYPDALVTTLNEEGVPQTESVDSFYESSDANPEAPAETSV
jgi:hypothetical protein